MGSKQYLKGIIWRKYEALHQGMQEIGWERMTHTVCLVSVIIVKVLIEKNMLVGQSKMKWGSCSRDWLEQKILWSLGMPIQLSLGSLSLVNDLIMKMRLDYSYTNQLGSGVVSLISLWQDKTDQHIVFEKYGMQVEPLDQDYKGYRMGLVTTTKLQARDIIQSYHK